MAEVAQRQYPIGQMSGLYTHSVYGRFKNSVEEAMEPIRKIIAAQKDKTTETNKENIDWLIAEIEKQKAKELEEIKQIGFTNIDEFARYCMGMSMKSITGEDETFRQFIANNMEKGSKMFRTLGERGIPLESIVKGGKAEYVSTEKTNKILQDLAELYTNVIDYHISIANGNSTDAIRVLKTGRKALKKLYDSADLTAIAQQNPDLYNQLNKINDYLHKTKNVGDELVAVESLKRLSIGSIKGVLKQIQASLHTYSVTNTIERMPEAVIKDSKFGQLKNLTITTNTPSKSGRSVVDLNLKIEHSKEGNKYTANINMSLKSAALYTIRPNKTSVDLTAHIATPSATQLFSLLGEGGEVDAKVLNNLQYLILNIGRFHKGGTWGPKEGGKWGLIQVNDRGTLKKYEAELFYLVEHLVGMFMGQSSMTLDWRANEDIHYVWFGDFMIAKSQVMAEVLNTMQMSDEQRRRLTNYKSYAKNPDLEKFSSITEVKFAVMMADMNKEAKERLAISGELIPTEQYDLAKKKILKKYKKISQKGNEEYYGILQGDLRNNNEALWNKISLGVTLRRRSNKEKI